MSKNNNMNPPGPPYNPPNTPPPQNNLVNAVFPKAGDLPPDMRILTGFLGSSAMAGRVDWWRLFISLDLKEYIDIPDTAIIWRVPIETETWNPLQISMLWVRRDVTLQYGSYGKLETPPQAAYQAPDQQASMLQGGITGVFLPQTGIPGLPSGIPSGMLAAQGRPQRMNQIIGSLLGGGGCNSLNSSQCPG